MSFAVSDTPAVLSPHRSERQQVEVRDQGAMRSDLHVFGPLAAHPSALGFAEEVFRVHQRYAADIVHRHGFCPFLKDLATGFGAFAVMLDPGLDVALAVRVVAEQRASVGHLVYPLYQGPAAAFEAFSAEVTRGLRELPEAPATATFHPDLHGETDDAHRLIGVLRRAPDPFIQSVPPGLTGGGTTVFVGDVSKLEDVLAAIAARPKDISAENFGKAKAYGLDKLLGDLAAIRADRDRSYAPWLARLTDRGRVR